MPGRKKRKKTSIDIRIGRAHRRSPHLLAVVKKPHGLTLGSPDDVHVHKHSADCAHSPRITTDHQFTCPLPTANKKPIRITTPNIDLAGKNHTPITDDHIIIEHHINDAFAPYYQNAQKKEARIREGVLKRREHIHHQKARPKNPHKAHTYVIRTTVMFALSALLVTAPFYTARFVAHAEYTKETLSSLSHSIASSIKQAGSHIVAGDTDYAEQELGNVEVEFAHAVHLLESFKRDTQLIASTVPPVRNKISSAHAISEAGLNITQAINSLKSNLRGNEKPNQFAQITSALEIATTHLNNARININAVKPNVLPADMRTVFTTLKREFNGLLPALNTASNTTRTLNTILTKQPRQTLLVLFQNNHEIRATGGFWGSFAIVTIKNGAIESIETPGGGTYDIKGQLDRHLRPPTPMQLIAKEWQFQDANWFPDFPTSADAAIWFLEHANYGTPDGVIAITPNVLEQIIDITGDIKLTSHNKTLNADNITHELQKAVELEYDKEKNKPKQIISDLANILFERVNKLSPSQKIALLSTVHESLNTKDILVYHQDEQLQKQLASAGWSGQINQSWNDDYLMVVNHNIAGQKTDEKITQDIIKQTTIHENGTITSDVTIRRSHTGKKGDLFNGVRNVNYLRVMVPKGSQLIHAAGFNYPDESFFKVPETFETYDLITEIERSKRIHAPSGTHITLESDKTTFGNWTMTDPGETTVVKLTYRLPFVLKQSARSGLMTAMADESSSYTLLVQKQPGADNTSFTHTINAPNFWNLISATDEDGDLVESYPLDTDKISGIVLSQPN